METTRERILATALPLFAARGYHGATTSEIATQAGVAEGTIYRHFRDKKELFLACVEPAIQETLDRLLAIPITGPAHEVIRQSLAVRIEVMSRHWQAFNILFAEASYHPELAHSLISRVLSPRHQQVNAALRTAVANTPRTRLPHPIILSVGLTAAIWAVLGLQRLSPEAFADLAAPLGPQALERELTDFVLYGLTGHPPDSANPASGPDASGTTSGPASE